MSFRAPIALPPTAADLAIARGAGRIARPAEERGLQVITWLADEKVVLAGTALLWLWVHADSQEHGKRRRADHMLLCVAAAGIVPHLFKHVVRRRRPDRTIARGLRRGIPRSGNAWDSFPSGHAVHLGAIARSLGLLAPPRWRPLVWPGLAALAATRILLLAHYASDVAAGLLMGVALDRALDRAVGLPRHSERSPVGLGASTRGRR
jgi:membrane-associated phospholipid phosphatase